MALQVSPVYQFDSITDTGIDKIPTDALIYVKQPDGSISQFVKQANSGMSATSTVADMLANTDLFKPAVEVPASLNDFADIEINSTPADKQILSFSAESGKWLPSNNVKQSITYSDRLSPDDTGIYLTVGAGGTFESFDDLRDWLQTTPISSNAYIFIKVLDGTYDITIDPVSGSWLNKEIPNTIYIASDSGDKSKVTITVHKSDVEGAKFNYFMIFRNKYIWIENITFKLAESDSNFIWFYGYRTHLSLRYTSFTGGKHCVFSRLNSHIRVTESEFFDFDNSGAAVFYISDYSIVDWYYGWNFDNSNHPDGTKPLAAIYLTCNSQISFRHKHSKSIDSFTYGIIADSNSNIHFLNDIDGSEITFNNISKVDIGLIENSSVFNTSTSISLEDFSLNISANAVSKSDATCNVVDINSRDKITYEIPLVYADDVDNADGLSDGTLTSQRWVRSQTIGNFADVDTSDKSETKTLFKWDSASGNFTVVEPGTIFSEINFDANDGDTEFTFDGLPTFISPFINGIKVRDSEYSISQDTDAKTTTVTFNDSLSDNDWVLFTIA